MSSKKYPSNPEEPIPLIVIDSSDNDDEEPNTPKEGDFSRKKLENPPALPILSKNRSQNGISTPQRLRVLRRVKQLCGKGSEESPGQKASSEEGPPLKSPLLLLAPQMATAGACIKTVAPPVPSRGTPSQPPPILPLPKLTPIPRYSQRINQTNHPSCSAGTSTNARHVSTQLR